MNEGPDNDSADVDPGAPGATHGRAGASHAHLRRLGGGRLGGGRLAALGVPAKAALLDRCAAAGLPVPAGLVLRGPALRRRTPAELAAQVVRVAPVGPLVVRSAFAAEDGDTSSSAGRFTSVVDVDAHDVDAVADTLARVLASAPTDAAEQDLAVLVQAQVAATHAGVAFTDPDHEDDLVDVVPGLADGLLAGREAGERTRLPRLAALERPRGVGWRPRLATLLRDVRRELGEGPGWDVEWADDGRRCWLVQVRPVTAAPVRDEALTLANHREILPDPPSVLMTSLVAGASRDLFSYWRGFAPDLPAGRPFVDELAGRPLINLSLLVDTMRRLGLPTTFVTDSIGGSSRDRLPPVVGPRPVRLAAHAPALVGLGIDQLRSPGQVDGLVDELRSRATQVDHPGSSVHEVLDAAHDVYVGLVTGMFALTTAISGPLALLQRLGTSAEHHARHRSAGTAIWDDLAPLHDLVEADQVRRAAVERGDVPDDPTFLRAWRRYLAAHGHRGVHESDLSRPRYHEDPAPLLSLLAGERRERDRDAARRTPRGVLTSPLWWQAARAIRAREELRSGAMRAFDVLRQRLLALADAACERRSLPVRDDLWDLTTDQARALDHGAAYDEAFLARRRDERAELARLRLPDVVWRSDDPDRWDPAGRPPAGDRLRGLPLTRGDVTGTVWRLDAPSTQPPDVDGPLVLVAPAVDAGWIATFARVDAVVVETGGELSHGSIVLRERGVPAVTNVGGATTLPDGARVRVRAAAGIVERVG